MSEAISSFAITWLILVTVLGGLATAQQELPESVEPGVIQEKLRQEGLEERQRREREKAIPPLEKPPEEKPERLPEEVKIFIRQIQVTGNTVIPGGDIREMVASFEGQTLSLSDLNDVARLITLLYQKRGYLTSLAYVPVQKIENETVEIRVVEGRLGDVTVEGARYFRPKFVSDKIFIKTGDILQFDKLETDLRRANRHPDKTVQGVLLRGKEPGTTDLVLNVKDRLPHHGRFSLDNQGTRLIGRSRFGIGYSNTNVLGFDDQANARVLLGRELNAFGASYQVPFNRYSTSLDLGYSHTEVHPQKEFEDLKVGGLATTYSLGFTQPFYWRKGRQGSVEIGYDHRESLTKLNGDETVRDELRVVKTGGNIRFPDRNGFTAISSDFRVGIPHLFGGAAVKQVRFGRDGGGGRFFKWNPGVIRVQRLPLKSTGILNLQAQVAAHKLAPSERYYLGGATTVRGYPEGEFLGENALLATTELQVPAFFLPDFLRFPISNGKVKEDLQMVGFLDTGKGWLKETTAGANDNSNLTSMGGGLRVRLFGNTFGRVEWGVPLQDEPSDRHKYNVHFSIATEVF